MLTMIGSRKRLTRLSGRYGLGRLIFRDLHEADDGLTGVGYDR